MNPAVFLDRDDTIIKNVPYNGDPSQVELLTDVKEALQLLEKMEFKLFIVSNQSGVGRGLITVDQVNQVNEEMNRQLDNNFFTEIYNCHASPDAKDGSSAEELQLRKPSPELLLQAAKKWNLHLAYSFFIGDRLSDIECGHNAGCRSILVTNGTVSDQMTKASRVANFTASTLLGAAQWIQQQTGKLTAKS
ncbi:MAG: HAD family hydrolase [Verrucomicrobiota bacterium]